MIVKVRGKMYDSDKESICVYLINNELSKLAHHYLSTNPSEAVLLFNGTRKETNVKDWEKTRVETLRFVKQVNRYVMKKNPVLKPLSSVEVA